MNFIVVFLSMVSALFFIEACYYKGRGMIMKNIDDNVLSINSLLFSAFWLALLFIYMSFNHA